MKNASDRAESEARAMRRVDPRLNGGHNIVLCLDRALDALRNLAVTRFASPIELLHTPSVKNALQYAERRVTQRVGVQYRGGGVVERREGELAGGPADGEQGAAIKLRLERHKQRLHRRATKEAPECTVSVVLTHTFAQATSASHRHTHKLRTWG